MLNVMVIVIYLFIMYIAALCTSNLPKPLRDKAIKRILGPYYVASQLCIHLGCYYMLHDDHFFPFQVNGFRRGILNISMEPSFLRSAAIKGGLNRRIKLDRNAGVDEVHSHAIHVLMLLSLRSYSRASIYAALY